MTVSALYRPLDHFATGPPPASDGSDLARRVLARRAEGFDFEATVVDVLDCDPTPQCLQAARHELSYGEMQATLCAQVDALLVVDAALLRLEHPEARWGPTPRGRRRWPWRRGRRLTATELQTTTNELNGRRWRRWC